MTMMVSDALKLLEERGNEKIRGQNRKNGAGVNQYGASLGDIRAIARKIRMNHELALELWDTGNLDAQFLAVLVMDLKRLSVADLDRIVRSISFVRVADWLVSYVITKHPEREVLRTMWMVSPEKWAARAGWALTASRIAAGGDGLDMEGVLDRIESEMVNAAPEVQWTMNNTLAAIGIHVPELRDRAIAVGESLGVYRDFPVSKGCTSPFAPIWIREMVRRGA